MGIGLDGPGIRGELVLAGDLVIVFGGIYDALVNSPILEWGSTIGVPDIVVNGRVGDSFGVCIGLLRDVKGWLSTDRYQKKR